jgi:hypothetical protein
MLDRQVLREAQVIMGPLEPQDRQVHKVYRVLEEKLVQQDLLEILDQLEPLDPKELQVLQERQARQVQRVLRDF